VFSTDPVANPIFANANKGQQPYSLVACSSCLEARLSYVRARLCTVRVGLLRQIALGAPALPIGATSKLSLLSSFAALLLCFLRAVIVNYCSSDSWIGASDPADNALKWYFHG
jgi:hypothetical protein